MVADLDLDRVEALEEYLIAPDTQPRHSYARFVCREDMAALLAAARRLLALEHQLATIKASGHCGSDVMTLERIEQWATDLGWSPPNGTK